MDSVAEALSIAVVVASSRGALDPLDLAAAELALCRPGLAEDASHAWARANLPLLVGDPGRCRASRKVPFGATSWRAIFRRAQNPDAKIAIGADCGFRVDDTTGRLWTWGNNLGSYVTTRYPAPMRGFELAPKVKVTAVSVGISHAQSHALACDSAGAVWAWGHSGTVMSDGKLGTPQDERGPDDLFDGVRSQPRRVAGFGVDADALAATTRNEIEKQTPPAFAVAVAAGAAHSVAVDAAGGAWAWGSNAYGQCGRHGATESAQPARIESLFRGGARVVVAAAGKTTTFLLDEKGKVWRCFSNAASVGAWAVERTSAAFGERDGERDGERGSDSDASAEREVLSVYDSTRWCARAFAEHLVVTHIALTYERAVFIDRRGDARAWGRSGDDATGGGVFAAAVAGPLRDGDLRDAGRLRRAAVSAGHSLVLACDGRVYGFGNNESHEVDARARATFVRGPIAVSVPFSVLEQRTKDEDAAVTHAACVSIAAGTSGSVGASAAVRASDGRVLTWGAPGPWLGRGVHDRHYMWAPGNEPAPVRFEETNDDAREDASRERRRL